MIYAAGLTVSVTYGTRARASRRKTDGDADAERPRHIRSRIARARPRERRSARPDRSRPERCVAGQKG